MASFVCKIRFASKTRFASKIRFVSMAHFVCLGLALLLAPGGANAAETVRFPGKDLTLAGVLYVPAGAGPFPAVVALHGCGGLYARQGGGLAPRHEDWGQRLAAQGFVVLFPDSFGPRGVGPQCRTRDRATRPGRERAADALAAKAWLQSRPDVRAEAVSVLGWSNGGSTVLYAVAADRPVADGKPDFAKAVAFYPGCRVLAERGGWQPRMATMILIGLADDWTPAEPCQALAAAAGGDVVLQLYPGAYHDFDHPDLKLHRRSGLAYSADGDGVAHAGTNPAARSDALTRVPAFLAR